MAEAKMKIKRIIRNLTYVIVVGAVLFIGVEIEMFLKQKIFRDLNGWIFFMVFQSAAPFIIGLILGIPHWLSNFRKEGKWTYDWIRLLTIGVPALLAASIPCLHYVTPAMARAVSGNYALIADTGGIVAGFVILTSARKRNHVTGW